MSCGAGQGAVVACRGHRDFGTHGCRRRMMRSELLAAAGMS
ncbi:hypothetical protein I551_2741 [Mycobacterium ulcerans str. Harvey]|uniref:Uncharacterized protein n=1 Tax=Mycobacterium ulcerans str. Harvey TaxID=1299332 RepID=A0ABN0R1H2_MYCUL|nr:hypothetical protein I551_2741 [Mycobacterium ulcerans str. Harvey]